eukprot:5042843-Karenia_brevis.AAC.1
MHKLRSADRFGLQFLVDTSKPKFTPAPGSFDAKRIHAYITGRSNASLGKDTFLSISQSVGRPETACGMSTCIRPSCKIYWLDEQLLLDGKDEMQLQGIWPSDG